MQRLLAGMIAATLLASSPIQAQETPAPLKDCRALLKVARGEIDRTPQTEIEDLEDGYRFTHVDIVVLDGSALRADELIMRDRDLLAVWEQGTVFEAGNLAVNGLSLSPGYKIDLELVYESDPDALTSNLERLYLNTGAFGEMTISGRLSQFDNADPDVTDFADMDGLLHAFDLSLTDKGLASLFFLAAGPIDETDIAEIATTIRAWPESRISTSSAETLVRFLHAMPDPSGEWTFHFESEEGFAIKHFAAPSLLDALGHLPEDTRITASAKR